MFTLSAQMMARTSSSRISAAVPGKVPRPAALSSARNDRIGSPSVAAPCVTSNGEKAWMCISGTAALMARQMREIGLAGVIRMDAALKADFGRASLPGFGRAADDFIESEVIRRAAQRLMRLALGEGAERAAVRAHVGVVDVAVDDVADGVAADSSAKLIGCGDNAAVIGVARREQPHDLRRVQAGAALSALDDALNRWIDGARVDRGRPRSDLRAGRPIVVTRETLGVAETARLRGDLRRGPDAKIAHVGGVDRQSMHEQLAGGGGALGKFGDRWPWRLRIDVIRGDRRDPAPIIDPRRDQPRIDARREVGGRLDVHRRTQDEARSGEAPEQIIKIGLRGPGELGARLGAEVLDDDFLNVPELPMQIADGEQRLEPLGARLADANENAGRERHAQLARESQRLETDLGPLVGRAVMNAARLAQPRAERTRA